MLENPIYGTSQVVFAYRDLDQIENRLVKRGLEWFASAVNPDGGWGAGADQTHGTSSVEETALAVEALRPPRTIPVGDPPWKMGYSGSSVP